jgi:hypothetical protein
MLLRFHWLQHCDVDVPVCGNIILIVGVGLVSTIPNAKTRFATSGRCALLRVSYGDSPSMVSLGIASNSQPAFIRTIAAVVVFLLWIYVSAVILMHGVEFLLPTRVSVAIVPMKCPRPRHRGVNRG